MRSKRGPNRRRRDARTRSEGRVRVLVTGGRAFSDRNAVYDALDRLTPKLVIQGGARGADYHARTWALKHAVPCITMDAPWKSMGGAAGPARNRWMIEFCEPDLVLAFEGGRGTADCVRRAREAGIEVTRG